MNDVPSPLFQSLQTSRHIPVLCKRHSISRLAVFGSVARGEDIPTSDIDILVSFSRPATYFLLLEVEQDLSDLLQRHVDLLTEGSLSPYLRESIVQEARVIYEEK